MHGYSQPTDYRFSHDSIELAQRVASLVSADIERRSQDAAAWRALDLCAGCGVVGLEFARVLKRPISIDFNEIQSVYRPHFDRNVEWIKSSFEVSNHGGPARDSALQTRWLEMNYEMMRTDEFAGRYDVVLSNPPYFDRVQGRLPPSEFKARCRFFLDSSFTELLKVVHHVLKPGGVAYVLVRGLEDHGITREEVLHQVLSRHGTWTWLEPVRGTGLIRFERHDASGDAGGDAGNVGR